MITVVGCDGSGLGDPARAALARATLVVGAPRHLAGASLSPGTPTAVLGNVDEAVCRLSEHVGDVVVLASGDPGLFGIVRRLRAGGLTPHVLPAVSSVALAFARLGLSWDDAVVVSAHGRDPRPALAAARAGRKVAVLTSSACGPAQVGAAVAGWGRTLVVCERLGAPDERIVRVDPEQVVGRQWHDPNVVLVLPQDPHSDDPRPASIPHPTPGVDTEPGWVAGGGRAPADWALPDDAFDHRDGMLTKYEVRALALARLGPRLGALVWDVGAGSGSVAVECARFGAAVVALERDTDEVARIRRNAAAHEVAVRAVLGEAPAALEALPDPDAVFVGGGGPSVVAACAAREPTRVVVALAAVERIGPTAGALEHAGYATDGVLVHASRLARLPGGAHRLAGTNPVALVWGTRE